MPRSVRQNLLVTTSACLTACALVASCAKNSEENAVTDPHGPYYSGDGGPPPVEAGAPDVAKDGPKAPGGGKQCAVCYKDADCVNGFRCLTSPYGDRFCSAPCPPSCSAGLACTALGSYPPALGDAGATPEAGGSDAAVSNGACVPPNAGTCPCNAEREGVLRNCYHNNEHGSCQGTQTCKTNAWTSCDAPMAAKEICDGKDNNCNALIDSQEPGSTGAELCAGSSGAPPHAAFACTDAKCVLGGCDPGWARFPPNIPDSAGCPCEIDKTDLAPASDNACAQAQDKGTLKDTGGAQVSLVGNLSSDTDVDWFGFESTDTAQDKGKNTYRVHLEFAPGTGNPGDEFRFDVVRSAPGGQCQGTTKTSLTSYDWCADNANATKGFADADCSGGYRIRVYRKPGAPPTCSQYTIVVTAGGLGGCPAADACGAQ